MAIKKWLLRVVSNKSQCIDFFSAGIKSSGCCREVTIGGGSIVKGRHI